LNLIVNFETCVQIDGITILEKFVGTEHF